MKAEDIAKLLRNARLRRMTKEGFTARELMKEAGLKAGAAGNFLRNEVEAGRIVFCGAKDTIAIDGRPCKSPAYKIVKP